MKKHVLMGMALICIASLSGMGIACSQSEAAPSPTPTPTVAPTVTPTSAAKSTQTVTISIPSTQPWTDAGLTVSEGDVVSITAWESVSWDYTGVEVGPDGRYDPDQGSCNFVVMDSNVPAQSLVGNIAYSETLDGEGFFVGSSFQSAVPIEGTTSSSGTLFLGFNDGAVFCDRNGYDAWGFGGDNHGSFTVEITITK